MANYKISVIIPIYNAEKTLKAAVRSVQQQTIGFENLQLILVDDHSTDGSFALAKSLAALHPNICVLQTAANSGSASAPRNLGMEHAEAPYLMFLDNDDLLDADGCRVLFEEAEKTGFDLIAGCYSEIHYGKKLRRVPYYDAVPARDFDFQTEMPAFRAIADPFWCKIFRTDIIRAHSLRFESDLYGEDTLFLLQYLVHCKTGRHIKANIYNYFIRDNSLFHVFDAAHFYGALVGDRKIRETLLSAGQQQYYHDYLTDHTAQMMDVIANAPLISDAEIPKLMQAWQPYFAYLVEHNLQPQGAYVDILMRDAKTGDYDRLCADMLALRALCREKNAALQQVLGSRGWRMLTKINQLLQR